MIVAAETSLPIESLYYAKAVVPVVLLALFWCWESWFPFFGQQEDRLRHAGRNLALAICNTVVLALTFGAVTVLVTDWTESNHFGLLNALNLSEPIRWLLVLVLLDGWTPTRQPIRHDCAPGRLE